MGSLEVILYFLNQVFLIPSSESSAADTACMFFGHNKEEASQLTKWITILEWL